MCGELELRLRGSGLVGDYSEANQPAQLFSSENNFLTRDLQREISIQAFSYFRTPF